MIMMIIYTSIFLCRLQLGHQLCRTQANTYKRRAAIHDKFKLSTSLWHVLGQRWSPHVCTNRKLHRKGLFQVFWWHIFSKWDTDAQWYRTSDKSLYLLTPLCYLFCMNGFNFCYKKNCLKNIYCCTSFFYSMTKLTNNYKQIIDK